MSDTKKPTVSEIQAYQSDPNYDNRYLRGQEDMREPMECGHPKACFVEEEGYESGGPQGWVVTQAQGCSACAEREKVRELCAVVCDDMDGWRAWVGIPGFTGAPTEADAAAGYLADKIRQLDLTTSLAPSTEEGKGGDAK